MKSVFAILFLTLFSVTAFAQGKISGTVFDENAAPIPFANIVLMAQDSSFVDGTITDMDGKFSLEKIANTKFLTVSCLGYETKVFGIEESFEQVVLKQSDLMLDEINIIAERKKIQIKNDAMVTNVGGTPIAKLSDIQHVLNIIPGVVCQNETLAVLGKGEPLVYINNRKIRDLAEVYQLSPDNIKNIELITNPGAKYDSEVKAVLIINTAAPTGEGLSIDNKLSVGYQYRPYFADNLKINYRHKNLDLFVSVAYAEKKFKEHAPSTEETFLSSYYNMFTDDYNYFCRKPFLSKIGMNYDFKSGNSFGFEYSNKLQNNDKESNTITNLMQDDILTDILITNNKGNNKIGYHAINIYNSGSLLSFDYEVDFDAMVNFTDYHHNINEVSDLGETIDWDCNEKNDASLYAFKPELYKDVLNGGITIGTEHSFVNRKGICEYLQKPDNNSDCRVKENNSAIYSEFNQDFDNWSFTLGLRYENVKSDYFEYEIKREECCKRYQNLFPSVSFDFSLGVTDFSLSYDRSTQRPYYEKLSNNIGFINRYSYETGNPLLKSAYFDDFCLNVVYNDLTFMADIYINYDYIYDSFINYGSNSQVSLTKPDNYDKFNSFQFLLSYSPTFGIYRPIFNASLFRQDMSIVFCNEKKFFNHPYGDFSLANLFELPCQATLNIDFNYSTSGHDELGWFDDSFACNLEISKIVGNWIFSILCDDVFKTEKHYFNMYGNIRKCTIEKIYDTRKLELSIRYKFNTSKSKYKGTGAGNDEKQRM
ncbi:MAG: TonB-dependent receptor [Bacteroidales bacterium]|nr:TonB-dependent receptor [Bacteroidales bacterium]